MIEDVGHKTPVLEEKKTLLLTAQQAAYSCHFLLRLSPTDAKQMVPDEYLHMQGVMLQERNPKFRESKSFIVDRMHASFCSRGRHYLYYFK